jgi:hypothetical protein
MSIALFKGETMSDTSDAVCVKTIADATFELNQLLLIGSFSERLMRLYALSELVMRVSPEALLKIVANFNNAAPGESREAA